MLLRQQLFQVPGSHVIHVLGFFGRVPRWASFKGKPRETRHFVARHSLPPNSKKQTVQLFTKCSAVPPLCFPKRPRLCNSFHLANQKVTLRPGETSSFHKNSGRRSAVPKRLQSDKKKPAKRTLIRCPTKPPKKWGEKTSESNGTVPATTNHQASWIGCPGAATMAKISHRETRQKDLGGGKKGKRNKRNRHRPH